MSDQGRKFMPRLTVHESCLTVMTVIFYAEILCDEMNKTLMFELSIIITNLNQTTFGFKDSMINQPNIRKYALVSRSNEIDCDLEIMALKSYP